MPKLRNRSTDKFSSPDIVGRSNAEIVAALPFANRATDLKAYFGEAEYEELHALARHADQVRVRTNVRVYVLPGIMGSSLGVLRKQHPDPIWLNPNAIEAGKLLSLALPDSTRMSALEVILPGYLKLLLLLRIAGFDAVLHAFDWRKSVAFSGRQLMQRLEREGKKSVAIVGHSMGGLVARHAVAIDHGQRIQCAVQLGTPNFGSFAPVQALRAVYASVRKIASLDPTHSAEQLSRHVFRSLPGLYELLPTANRASDVDLLDLSQWPQDLLGPDATLLSQARLAQRRSPRARANCFHIVGVNRETVTAVAKKRGGFEYLYTHDGDGTVPCVLAEWPGAQHFFVEEQHGSLTKNDRVAAAVVDLLKSGATRKLPGRRPAPQNKIVRRASDAQLRRALRGKVRWSQLPPDERRALLDPTISPQFLALAARATRSPSARAAAKV